MMIDIIFYGQQMVLQIGKTKVFLRAGQLAELDGRRTIILGGSAKVIQSQARTRITRKQYIAICRASVDIQSFCRGELIGSLVASYFVQLSFFFFFPQNGY